MDQNNTETVAAAAENTAAVAGNNVAETSNEAAVAEAAAVPEVPTVEKLAGEISGLNTRLKTAEKIAAESTAKIEAAEKARSEATVKNAELEKQLAESMAKIATLEAAQKTAEKIAAEKYAAAVDKPVDAKVVDAKSELKAKYDSLKSDPYAMGRWIRGLTPDQIAALVRK